MTLTGRNQNNQRVTAVQNSAPYYPLWRMPDGLPRFGVRDQGGDDWSSQFTYTWLRNPVNRALLAAAKQWQVDGLPDNPKGWLITAASRRRIEMWRSDDSRRRREEILAVAAGLASKPAGDPMNDEALLGAWCRLEAFAKARGEGLSHLLGELGLRKAAGRQLPRSEIATAARRLARHAGIEIAGVRLPHGLYGAVAAPGLAQSPRLRRFPTDLEAIRRILSARG